MERRENKHAAIYFEPGATQAMKDLAAQIRGEGGRTTLVWSNKWRGPENLLTEARAVVIQKGCVNEQKIVDAYIKFGVDVEIHYVDQDGCAIDEGATANEAIDISQEKVADTVLEEAADSEGTGTADSDDSDTTSESSEHEEHKSAEDGEDIASGENGADPDRLED